MDDQADGCHLSGGIFPGEFSSFHQLTPLVCYCGSVSLLYEQNDGHYHATGEDIPAASEPEGSPAPGPSSSPVHSPRTPPLPVPPLPDILSAGTPLVGCPLAEFLSISTQKKTKLLSQQFT